MTLSRFLPLGVIALGLTVSGCQSTATSNSALNTVQQINTATNHLESKAGMAVNINLTSGKTLYVNLPTNWTVEKAVNLNKVTHIEFTNKSVPQAPKVMMSLVFNKYTNNQLLSLPAIRKLVENNSKLYQNLAFENPILTQKLPSNDGYYFKLTDKTINPNKAHGSNEHIYMFQGAILVEDGVNIISGFSDDLSRDEQQILSIFNSAQVK